MSTRHGWPHVIDPRGSRKIESDGYSPPACHLADYLAKPWAFLPSAFAARTLRAPFDRSPRPPKNRARWVLSPSLSIFRNSFAKGRALLPAPSQSASSAPPSPAGPPRQRRHAGARCYSPPSNPPKARTHSPRRAVHTDIVLLAIVPPCGHLFLGSSPVAPAIVPLYNTPTFGIVPRQLAL